MISGYESEVFVFWSPCLTACVVTTTQHPPRRPREFMPLQRSDDSCFFAESSTPLAGMVLRGDPPKFCLRAAARNNGCRSSGVRHAGNCARAAAHGVQARVRRRALARLPKMPIYGNNGRQQSAGAAQRGSLAYQLGRIGLDHYQSAALVSAGAVTSYASHSTNLSPSLSSGLREESHEQKNVTKVF